MSWRPLYAEPPPAGSMIVVRTKGCQRAEVCGEWIGGGWNLASAFVDTTGKDILVPIPEDPEYLLVGAEPAPVLTPVQVFTWFAAETAALDNGQGQKLEHYGLGRLWCLLARYEIDPEGLELAVLRNRISEIRWNVSRGPGWILVQTDRHPVRCWFARKR